MMCFRAGSVRELLRSSSSKFMRLWLQFSIVQFPSSNLLWKVRSVQFNKVPLISKVQFVQFKIHSVQSSSTFSSGGRPPPPDEAAFSVPTVRDPTSRPWTDPGRGRSSGPWSPKGRSESIIWPGLCSTNESWVKFDSTLTQMSRVRVESAVKIKDMSRVRVESCWSSFESELSQLDTAWVKIEAMIFRGENVKILQLSVTLQRKNQPTATFDRTPPPGQQLFTKLSKMWLVVSQIWVLTQLCLKWVESELSQVSKFGFWVESELSHLDCHMSQSRVSPKKWVEHNPASDHLKKSQSSMENERFSYENKDQEEPEGEKHGMRYHKN